MGKIRMPWKRSRYCLPLFFLFISIIILSGCSGSVVTEKQNTDTFKTNDKEETKEDNPLTGNIPIEDNDILYEEDDDTSVITMYLTVRQGNAEENTNHTWQQLNGHSNYYYDENGIDRYQVEGILQIGDENGPKEGELGYGLKIPNSIVSIRGQSSSRGVVKSYKIKIKDGKGSWREQQTINLNKHLFDGVRFRNKLCYDLMEELPGMISLRTQFVHLYVKDETVEGNSGFKDYGLFTQVEQPNKTFLRNHGFDSYGQLYKVNFFEFRQYEDVIKLKSDAGYDEKAFEELLEIKGDDDHSKLISMLADVNNYEKPIKEIFNEWFDEDNFFSWMAFHILTGNIDTQSRNTLLYSPLNINKWYFISWDNDASFMQFEQLLKDPLSEKGWEYGISNYWGNVLFQRVLKSSYYRQKLDEKIEEYRKIITEDKLTKMIAGYKEVTDYYRNHLPDIMNNRLTNENYEKVCKEMPKEIEENYQLYKQSLEAPMPFYIGTPQVKDNKLHFDWDVSYDFDMENINYTFELARDYTFKETVIKEDNLIIPETETDKLKPGQYFIRITSENESGYKQYAFDYYNTDNGKMYGVKCFYVLEDGSIEEDAYEE